MDLAAALTSHTAGLQALQARRVQTISEPGGLAALANVELDLAQAELAQTQLAQTQLAQMQSAQTQRAQTHARAGGWAAHAAITAAAALLAKRFEGGSLQLRWPDGVGCQTKLAPQTTGQVGQAGLAPARWVQALACAWLAGETVATAVLADPFNLQAVFMPPLPGVPAAHDHRPWCETLAALARGVPVTDLHQVTQAVQRDILAGAGPDPAWLEAEALRLLPAIAAMADKPAAVPTLLAQAQAEDARLQAALADQLLPLPSLLIAGLQRLVQSGAATPTTLPPHDAVTPSLAYQFAPQQADGAAEIHWYFDGLGAPRAGRTHRLLSCADGGLMAVYQLPVWPAVPGAQASFILQAGVQLLDRRQLQRVASQHAAAIPAAPAADAVALRKQRLHLADAVGCLDLALRRWPEGERQADGAARSACVATRDEYRSLLAQVDHKLAPLRGR